MHLENTCMVKWYVIVEIKAVNKVSLEVTQTMLYNL